MIGIFHFNIQNDYTTRDLRFKGKISPGEESREQPI